MGDGRVSRHHCLLETDPPRVRIRDLGSLNGTFVNGRRLGGNANPTSGAIAVSREAELRHGDRLTIGATNFRVVVETGIQCAECRKELDPIELSHAVKTGEAFVCETCASKWTLDYRPTFQIVTTNCSQCGAAITASVADSDAPVCPLCRERGGAASDDLRRIAEIQAEHEGDAVGLAAYRLGRELGRGKQCTVYHAVRRADGADVAVKLLPIRTAVDEKSRARFHREISVLSQLTHPHIVRLHDFGITGGLSFLVTEYCNAGTLDSFVAREGGRLRPALAAGIMEPLCIAMEFAHRLGVVHRDLKPRNVLLDDRNSRLTPKIADFGFAKAYEEAGMSGLTLTGDAAGTPHFMPREQLIDYKHVGPASDVWSLAATYYFVLTGTTPLNFASSRDPLEIILNDEPTPIASRVPDLPRATVAAIDAALLTDLAIRPKSVAEFYHRLTGNRLD